MNEELRSELQRRVRQFLVHSYIYYQLNDSIISDHQYDWLCNCLAKMVEDFPDADVPYYDLVKEIGNSGSGFYIQEYPPAIITTALKMLWLHRKQNPDFLENFSEFIGRWGRRLEE